MADNVADMLNDAPQFTYFKDAGDFLLVPPFLEFVVVAHDHLLIKVEVLTSEEARAVAVVRGHGTPVPDDTHWVYSFQFFQKLPFREVLRLPCAAWMTVKADGRAHKAHEIDLLTTELDRALFAATDLPVEMLYDQASQLAALACFTVTLMNCRNVERVAHSPTRQQRRRMAREGHEPYQFYTLHIARTRKEYQRADGEGGKRRLHIARGHFKTYTEAAPLFGKHVGTYYWEHQTRGDKGEGVIEKGYRVR